MIESASTQGHNMANRDLQRPGSGSLVQTSKFCGPETGTAMLDMRSDRNRAASGTVASIVAARRGSVGPATALFVLFPASARLAPQGARYAA